MRSVDAFGCEVLQTFSCGKCIECLKDVQNSWKIRLCEEYRDHKYCYFFTLTYNDDSVPRVCIEGESVLQLDKSHVQRWIKRNRIYFERYFKRDIDFMYFVCGEYGPKTGRPHYHGIIFTDISVSFIVRMFNDWSESYGFVRWSQVGVNRKAKTKSSPQSVGNYVAKYCCKVPELLSDAEKKVHDLSKSGLINPYFRIMSKHIGLSYISRMKRYHVPNRLKLPPKEFVSKVVDRLWYHEGAFKYKLPRYYKDRLIRKKFPYLQNVWNVKLKRYESKTVYRYASKNLLSLQVQSEIRSRLLIDFNKRVAELRSLYPLLSDSQIYSKIALLDSFARKDRQCDIFSKMSRFYNCNRFKTPKF